MLKLLDDATRRLLDRLRLPVTPRATAARQGGHRSPVMASGLEFADHRQYVPGDDIRQLDWKAFARHRELVLRQFEEERDARVYVLVDVSASMTRGDPAKVDVARRLAAAFGYLGMKQHDSVRIVPFADGADAMSEPLQKRGQLPELERFIDAAVVGGTTSFEETVRHFAMRFRQRGLVVVVTDLMTPKGWEPGFRVLGGLGHQLVVVRVTCAEDDAPDFRGEVELYDAETGERLRLRASPELIASYRQVVGEHVERCRETVRRVGGRLVAAPVDVPTVGLIRDIVGGPTATAGAAR